MAGINSTTDGNTSFNNAHSALLLTFHVSGHWYERAEKNRLTSPSLGSEKGLSGLDGDAQWEKIRTKVKALGECFEAVLIARAAPKTLPCECGAPTCLGYKTNREWFDAISYLSDLARNTLAPSTDAKLRTLYIERHFTIPSLRESLNDIAAHGDINHEDAAQQFSKVSNFLNEIESSAAGAWGQCNGN